MAAASDFKNNKMEIKKIIDENNKLQEELDFFKSISSFPNSLVGNMFVKYIDGKKVWVDRQNITHDRELLHKLDTDSDVSQWIDDIDIKFKDRYW